MQAKLLLSYINSSLSFLFLLRSSLSDCFIWENMFREAGEAASQEGL